MEPAVFIVPLLRLSKARAGRRRREIARTIEEAMFFILDDFVIDDSVFRFFDLRMVDRISVVREFAGDIGVADIKFLGIDA